MRRQTMSAKLLKMLPQKPEDAAIAASVTPAGACVEVEDVSLSFSYMPKRTPE